MTEKGMIINAVHIRKPWSSEPDKAYTCEVEIDYEHGAMKLKLDHEKTQEVIMVVRDLIVDGARRVADELGAQAMAINALEHKPTGSD